MKNICRFAALAIAGAAMTWAVSAQQPRRVTVDDLMALRTINDVKISPAGDRVAFVVSTPSVARNAHEAELYVVPVAGGTPVRVAPEARIFVPALPAPRLRWFPDGGRVSFLGLADGRPQVMTAPAAAALPEISPRPPKA